MGDREGATPNGPSVSSALGVGLEETFPGESELAAQMRVVDWSQTSLGPLAQWPQSLRKAVHMCLSSRFPIVLWCGPELLLLYNDAFRSILGSVKRLTALAAPGRAVWAESWHLIGPVLEGVVRSGVAVWSDDQLLLTQGEGFREDASLTWSCSPIFSALGEVHSVFCAVIETTRRTIRERRTRVARDLATDLLDSHSAAEVCFRAGRTLMMDTADIPFALLYHIDLRAQQATLECAIGFAAGTPLSPRTVRFRDSTLDAHLAQDPWSLAQATNANDVVLTDSINWSQVEEGQRPRSAVHSVLTLPLTEPGLEQPTAILVAGISPRRQLDAEYLAFYDVLRGHLTTALAAIAYVGEAEHWLPGTTAEGDQPHAALLQEAPSPAPQSGAMATDGSTVRLVLADDNAAMREYLRHVLSERYTVEAVSNGAAALAAIQWRPPALVIVDVRMLVGDDLGLLRALRDDPRTRAIPVILLSTRPGEAAVIEGMQAGADDYLIKPFSARELLSRVAARLEVATLRNEALERARELLATFDAVTEGIAVYDADGHLIRSNAAQREMIARIIPSAAATVHERVQQAPILDLRGESMPEGQWALTRILRGKVIRGADAVEIIRRPPTGEDIFFSLTGGPLLADDGHVVGAVVASRDVTQQRALERVVRASERRYRTLVEMSALIVWRNDASGKLLGRIPMWEELTGQKGEAYWMENGWLDSLHPDDRQRVEEAVMRALRQDEPFEVEYRVRDRNGAYRWILSRQAPVRDESGKVLEWVGAATDIHERKEAEQALHRTRDELERRVEERTFALTNAIQSLRALSQRVLDIQESERRRIARELHDEIGQALTAIKMMVEIAERRDAPNAMPQFTDVKDVIDEALARVQELALDLRPAILDNLGLLPALLWQLERFSKQTGIRVEFRHFGLNGRLTPELEISVYRLVQEALTNVARHAGVQVASVHLLATETTLTITIADQGRGFTVEAIQGASTATGLAGMRERITLLGGMLNITSSPGAGTTVVAELPIAYARLADPSHDDAEEPYSF